jgi:uncharacterized protein YcbK (DUF882 family)
MADKQFTAHFNSREFNCRDGAVVQERDYEGLEYLCRTFLEPIRAKFGVVRINSGYRTANYNAKIGGASKSFHIYDIHTNDQAADITCQNGTPRDWHRAAAWIRTNKRNGRGGLGLYSRFIHIDIRESRADWRG